MSAFAPPPPSRSASEAVSDHVRSVDGPLTPAAACATGLGVGAAAALVFGLIDGFVAARVRTPQSALDLGACLAGAVFTYAIVALPAGLGAALVASAFTRRSRLAHARATATAVLALGLFFELYWHTRAWILPGASAVSSGRLIAAGVLAFVASALAFMTARGLLAPQRLRLARGLALGGGALTVLGAAVALRGGVADSRGRIVERNADLPNVLLIVVDALRHDVLGPYGAEHVRTPVLDDLARRGVVFENTRVQAPYTWTSFGSILTGKYPRRHGLVKMAPGVRMRPNVTLAWHLNQAPFVEPERGRLTPDDYVGATFMTGALSNGSGLMRGFDFYFEAMSGHSLADNDDFWTVFRSELLVSLVWNKLCQRFQESPVNSAARAWFEDHADRRFLAMVHYYSTHTPYAPPKRFRERYCDPAYDGPFKNGFWSWHREAIERGDYAPTEADKQQIRDLYYAATEQADEQLGELFADLEARGVLDQTLIVFTSDHGEELGEHGVWEHNFMYQTNLQIPLIMAGPGVPVGRRVSALVETVDLVPTLCELIGIQAPGPETNVGETDGEEYSRIDGTSLVPLMRGDVDWVKDFAFAENGRFVSIEGSARKIIVTHEGLVEDGWQKILSGETERPRYFDLDADPGEFDNRFDPSSRDVLKLYERLAEYDDEMPRPLAVIQHSQRDKDAMANQLAALGYTSGGIGQELEASKPESESATEDGDQGERGAGAGDPTGAPE